MTQPIARRAHNTETHQKQDRPKLFHHVHHIEPNGTVHTYCGLKDKKLQRGTHTQNRILCPACDAAKILWGVEL